MMNSYKKEKIESDNEMLILKGINVEKYIKMIKKALENILNERYEKKN